MPDTELSIPVIWAEDGASPFAGRLDVLADHLHLDGGVRDDRRTRDLPYSEISGARMGRECADRINGRTAIVLALVGGGSLSFVGFDRPGTLTELLGQLQRRAGIAERG